MSLDLKLFSDKFPQSYGLGPGTDIISYLNPHELRLNRALDKKYYKYCDKYIHKYISLMEDLVYRLFVEPNEDPPANQMGYGDWKYNTNIYNLFNIYIKNNNTTKKKFHEQYVEIFRKMFKLKNIDEFSYLNKKNLIRKCDPKNVSSIEKKYNVELQHLQDIFEQAEQLSTGSLSW